MRFYWSGWFGFDLRIKMGDYFFQDRLQGVKNQMVFESYNSISQLGNVCCPLKIVFLCLWIIVYFPV